MPSTYICLNVHIVFSTKNRQPILPKGDLHWAWQYMGGTLRGMGFLPHKVGRTVDDRIGHLKKKGVPRFAAGLGHSALIFAIKHRDHKLRDLI